MQTIKLNKGVQTQSWDPFTKEQNGLFDKEVLTSIATKHQRSIAQIERNIYVIPKSVHKECVIENINIVDFKPSIKDMALIATSDMGKSGFFDHHNSEIVK